VWSEVKKFFNLQLRLNNFTHIRQWTLDWISSATAEQNTALAVTVWHLWEARNAVRNGEAMQHPSRIVQKIKAYYGMIMEHTFKPANSNRRESNRSFPKWIPPPEGKVMLNVDAAIFAHSRCMGAGFILRNDRGQVLLAGSRRFAHIQDPELAEAVALRYALFCCLQANFLEVSAVSDCSNLIAKIKDRDRDRSASGVVISDIKKMVDRFSSVNFSHQGRLCNRAAHSLARGAESEASVVWVNEVPEVIRTIICNELVFEV
jgi:ribonuclease HI